MLKDKPNMVNKMPVELTDILEKRGFEEEVMDCFLSIHVPRASDLLRSLASDQSEV